MIGCIIPLGKNKRRYINECLRSIPNEVSTYLVDDTPKQVYKDEIFSRKKLHYKVYKEPSPYYRASEAIRDTVNDLDESIAIIGIVDDDTDFNVEYSKDLQADCIIPVDGFFNKVSRLLTRYHNLVVFGMRIDKDFDSSFKRQRYTHPDIIWSTENNIQHAWNLMHSDGTCFIRKDFLKQIGGYPEGDGYGEQKADLCRRAIRFGGVIGIFRDLPYYHNMHDSKIWRVSTDLPCDIEIYKGNKLERA